MEHAAAATGEDPALDALARRIGAVVHRHRAAQGLSLGELGRAAGLSKTILARIERGDGNPSMETLWRISKALGLPLGALLADVPHTRPVSVIGTASDAAMIERFGPLGKILYVHLRDVQGTVPRFQECFLGEGNYNPAAIVLALKRNGFDGFLLDDHVPAIVNDTLWGHRSRAHAIGYIQGLLKMMETTGAA